MNRLWRVTTLATLIGCTGKGSGVPRDEVRVIPLAGPDTSFAELELPDHARGDLGEPTARIPLRNFREGQGEGVVTRLPIRTRNLYFFKPSPGMRVVRADGTEVPHRYFQPKAPPSWSYDDKVLRVHGWDGVPGDEELFLEYPTATARERRLNFAWSGETDRATFARTSVQAGSQSRTGLLLPAPARASFDLTVPTGAALTFSAALIAPEVADGPPSDGAELRVVWTSGGQDHELLRQRVDDDAFRAVRVDLSAHAGEQGRLALITDPGATSAFDYVFLADPTVASVAADPRRVFLVFVDTLRPDHLGTYGYARETSPHLDAIAAGAARFTAARSVAPWTLPSTRTMLTGNHPEAFFASPTLPARLNAAGYATAMFAGNLYLSANFGINRDWGLHDVELLPRAERQLDKALAWLDEQTGRDVLLLVHLMDAHLPYDEPKEYRRMFAGDTPESLGRDKFHRDAVTGGRVKSKEDRQFIRDRYDNNIRYADDQLQRLYERMGPNDVLVFVSDHGEEFWEHGGYEHGHTLFDELLRVPLIVRAPGLTPGAYDVPVSMLDVTPTILDLAGLPHDDLVGRSLADVGHGDANAAASFLARPQAFGRPLYGGERWGVLDGTRKYSTYEGRELLFDLASDPGERKDQLRGDLDAALPMRARLGEALGRQVAPALRFAARGARKFPDADLVVTATIPGGIAHAWVGEDPTEGSAAKVTREAGTDTVVITWPVGFRGSRDVWVIPSRPIEEVTAGMRLHATEGTVSLDIAVDPKKPDAPNGDRVMIVNTKVGERGLEVGFGIMPIPDEGTEGLSGYDPELAGQLEAMGYAVGGH